MPNNYTISLPSSGDAGTLDADPGDKVAWKNDTGETVTLNLPSCVSPQNGPITLAAGATSQQYTVNSGATGTYDYDWTEGAALGTGSGKINVN